MSLVPPRLLLCLAALALLACFAFSAVGAHRAPKSGLVARYISSCKRADSDCLLHPEETQGPYYWNSTVRSNITEGKAGVPLTLKLTVVNVDDCGAIHNATVDLWHCDAFGMYSHYTSAGAGGLSGASVATDNSTFLRGVQFSDADGLVTFETIFPGHYVSRDTHIHLKVHVNGTTLHTGQLFFNDSLNDAINALSPYNTNPDERTLLAEDGIYTSTENASYGLLTDVQFVDASASYAGGLVATMTLGVSSSSSSSATPTASATPSAGSVGSSSAGRLVPSLPFL